MRNLKDILDQVNVLSIHGEVERLIDNIQLDSRKVNENSLFIAQKGSLSDGHDYISQVIEKGVKAVVCEVLPSALSADVCYVQVKNTHSATGLIASAFYNYPTQQLKMVGVTGTNGKTTTATLLYDLFTSLGYVCGLISTVTYKVGKSSFTSTHTTPDAIRLNELLSEMVEAQCEYCFMEVSSHAIHQERIAGLEFKAALFTNITHDHLDYHKTFNEYIRVKKLWFDGLSDQAFSLINSDDKNGRIMVQNTKSTVLTYALRTPADYKAKVLEMHATGMLLQINNKEVWVKLIGDFNVYNIAAVYATALQLGLNEEEVLTGLSQLNSVNGRFETIEAKDGRLAIVDYAHTPDALKNVLSTIKNLQSGEGNIITVFGAGGDRDKTKRPEMGKIAAEYSDKLIVTSDNPRSEDPIQIIEDIKAGIYPDKMRNSLFISDRREAIRTACMIAQAGDLILVAGKGHETYQEVNGVRSHFDDREEIRNVFNADTK